MRNFFYLTLVLTFATSCKDQNIIDHEYLNGKWVVEKAFRNDKMTNTLEGAFFYFDGNILTSNFMGLEQQASYQLKNNQIFLTKGMDYSFDLKKLGPMQLELKVEIQKTPFVFSLKKQ